LNHLTVPFAMVLNLLNESRDRRPACRAVKPYRAYVLVGSSAELPYLGISVAYGGSDT
jgi:hypothetical protein